MITVVIDAMREKQAAYSSENAASSSAPGGDLTSHTPGAAEPCPVSTLRELEPTSTDSLNRMLWLHPSTELSMRATLMQPQDAAEADAAEANDEDV